MMTIMVETTSLARLILVTMAALLFSTSYGGEPNGKLIVEVSGFQSSKGKAMIALSNSEAAYSGDQKNIREVRLDIDNGRVLWTVTDLPSGEYAIKIFHDENANGKLDSNFVGIPKEGIGFSNNARARMGPPSYTQVKFRIQNDVVKQTIGLNYL